MGLVVRFKKGVSPIVATLLLILIAMAAGVMLWLWTSGFLGILPTQQQTFRENIKIEAATVKPASNTYTLTIYVRNVGDVEVAIANVYVYNSTDIIGVATCTGATTVAPGDVKKVDATITTGGQGVYIYVVKVVTVRGTEATYNLRSTVKIISIQSCTVTGIISQ